MSDEVQSDIPAVIDNTPLKPTEPPNYDGISQLTLGEATVKILQQPIPVEDLDVLPTGEVYASQVRYRRILNAAFGPGGWGLRPRGGWLRQDNMLCREYALFVAGHYVSEAIGECEYQENNPRMTWATATEGVKSIALVRCCKDLGIASECWDRHFCDAFQATHCVKVLVDERGAKRVRWRRKEGRPLIGEMRVMPVAEEPEEQAPQVIAPPRRASGKVITEPQRKRLWAIGRERHTDSAIGMWLMDEYGLETSKEVKVADYDKIVERLRDTEPLNHLDDGGDAAREAGQEG